MLSNWEQIKKAEKGRDSVMDGIPKALPALAYAYKVIGKAQGAVEVPGSDGEVDDLGGELLALVAKARRAGVDPEDALRQRAAEFVERFRAQES